MDKYQKIGLSLLFLLIAFITIKELYESNQIDKHKTKTIAKILSKERSKGAGEIINYRYYFDSVFVNDYDVIDEITLSNYSIGSCYETEISVKDPEYSRLTIKKVPCPCELSK